jgi:transposase
MKAYSADLRERVLRAADRGMARREIVKVLGVSLATIGRYLKQRREMGHVKARSIPGRPSEKMAALQARLTDQLQRVPDATLQQHAQYWQQTQGMPVSRWSVGRAIKRIGWTRKKKTLGATERSEEARRVWREEMKEVDANLLVIVDETGSNIGLTPLYAWAPKGQRAIGSVPRNYGKNTTLLASLSLDGMGAAMILDGSTDTLAFEQYIEQVLAPSLRPDQIVVMDKRPGCQLDGRSACYTVDPRTDCREKRVSFCKPCPRSQKVKHPPASSAKFPRHPFWDLHERIRKKG